MRLLATRLLLSACALLAVVPATAGAATTPKVTSVAPLKLKIGEKLTIKGSGFRSGKNKNTVIFKAKGARAVFVKAEKATKARLTVKVPAKLAAFLKVRSGQAVATRFQLRVLSKKLSKAYTPTGKSPSIAPATGATTGGAATTPAKTVAAVVPATPQAAPAPTATIAAPNCDGDSQIDAVDADDDNDILPDTLERQIGTTVCDADSDDDGMEDGWEYQSATDWNALSCPAAEYPTPCPGAKPYPAKRPYVNPLFADAGKDYDGDYLPAGLEHAMWKAHKPNTLTNMWYSDGKQASQDSNPADGCVGLVEDPTNGHVAGYPTGLMAYPTPAKTNGTPRYQWLYGLDAYTLDTETSGINHGCLSDEERDEDGDFLSNAQEANLMMTGPAYVQALYQEPAFKEVLEGTDLLDPDTDGDGIVDGIDDQDQDDFWNVEEIRRGWESSVEEKHADGADQDTNPDPSTASDTGKRTGLWVDPYNPCLPWIHSRSCPKGVLLGGTPWRPFYDTEPPLRRWPLYGESLFDGAATTTPQEEIYSVFGAQTLPLALPGDPTPGPHHPLFPRPS
jgi:hypothetical protein